MRQDSVLVRRIFADVGDLVRSWDDVQWGRRVEV